MLSLKMKKLFISLVVITVMVLTIGSVSSLATQIKATTSNTENSVSATVTVSNNTEEDSKNEASNEEKNTNKNTNVSTNTNTKKTNNTVKNTNTNSKASGSLPYAGTNTSVVFVVIALVASALYAYKKVSDYNI